MSEESEEKKIRQESTFERALRWLVGITMGSIVILFYYQFFRTGKLGEIPSTLLALMGIEFGALLAFKTIATTITATNERELETERRIQTLQEKARQDPGEIQNVWEVASERLKAYFDRNLNQVKLIFLVAIIVMLIGFAFVLTGVVLAFIRPDTIKASYVSAISGVITQFIGVTFMIIYRSTMSQATSYIAVLERINKVGMAVKIVESIDAGAELKNEAKVEVARLILIADMGRIAIPSRARRTKAQKKAVEHEDE